MSHSHVTGDNNMCFPLFEQRFDDYENIIDTIHTFMIQLFGLYSL